MTSPIYFEQPLVIFDTTESLNASTGSFVIYGGVSIGATYQSSSVSTGAFVVSGGIATQKNINVGGVANIAGITTITNSTESTGVGNGALVVLGGMGLTKDLNVGGDATITGNLYVNGTATYVNTTTIDVQDNTLVINAGPAGSRDAGLLFHRDGVDVVSETAVTSGTLNTIGSSSFTLGSSFISNYVGWWLKTSDGSAQIATYNGTSGTFYTTGNTFTTPTELSFDLYNKSYVANYYDESADELRLGFIANATDPQVDLENFGQFAKIRADTLYANTAVSTANLIVTNSATIANLALASANLDSETIGNLYVTASSVLHGFVTTGGLMVTGPSTLRLGLTTGSINNTGDSLLHGFVTAGALNVTGDSILQGFTTIGSLFCTGESFLNGATTIGSLAVTGSSILRLGLTTGSINNTGDSLLHGFVTAGALAVTGASFFMGNMLITGGNLTVSGGSVVFNTVDVSPSMADIIKERSATIGNNVSTPTNINTFLFANSVARAFDAVVSVTVNGTTSNTYAYYNLKGIQKASGWLINSSFVGDVTGVTFSITSGQLQYTSTNKLDFDSAVVKFRALTTTV